MPSEIISTDDARDEIRATRDALGRDRPGPTPNPYPGWTYRKRISPGLPPALRRDIKRLADAVIDQIVTKMLARERGKTLPEEKR
jgi:hypothetical protein